jgi:pyruvate formate lyase activating enzyme
MPDAAATEGTVLTLQRMSTDDGPGIRTTVFLKGCTLTCSWCHNPESIDAAPRIVWNGERCMACHTCVAVCPEGALVAGDGGIVHDPAACRVCETCTAECPTGAMELLGTRWGIDALVRELAKDRAFFEQSGGGVTLSGGEPAMQLEFVTEVLDACHDQGLHTVVDTCGMCSERRLRDMASRADLVLYDLKLMDSEAHQRHAGQPNQRILENARALARMVAEGPRPGGMWVRTPLIPGITDGEDNLRRLGAFIADELGDAVQRWDLCAFNNLCEGKYRRLGWTWGFADERLLTDDELGRLGAVARASGVDPDIVQTSGATRLEQGT